MKQAMLPLLIAFFSSCHLKELSEDAEKRFADQGFKTAIAQVELYNLRYGHYPESLDSLKYLGDWDQLLNDVEYTKLDSGYQLDILKGLEGNKGYPDDFWHGLGLKKSNLLEPK